jgi:acyl-coenzyme A thioesterase PaaI-like protein
MRVSESSPNRRVDDLPLAAVTDATQQLDWTALSDTSAPSAVLRQWQRASRTALGRWLFAKIVCRKAPYFATIKPRVLELAPGIARFAIKKRRAVENHIGSVHAIAMANLCELAAGLATEVSIPASRRWIPRGMTIEYLKRADSDVTAVARLATKEWNGPANIGVPVSVTDQHGQEVVRAVITMYVSPRPTKKQP